MSKVAEIVRISASRQGAGTLGRIVEIFVSSLVTHRIPLSVFVIYFLSCLAYVKLFHLERLSRFSLYGVTGVHLLLLTLMAFLIIYCVKIAIQEKPDRLFPVVAHRLRSKMSWERFFNAGFAILCFYLLLSVFSNYKRMIPLVVPFYLDTYLYELDKTIHFGMDPWQLLQPVLGHPLMTFFINFLYNIWVFIAIMVFYWQAFSGRDKELRMQYIISFLMCWALIGTLAATLLSSAGPCFYGDLVSLDNPYEYLMAYLVEANEQYPIWALDMQATLLSNYYLREIALASGITAMPSMHVSIAWLMALLGWRVSRFTGYVFSIYCGFIIVGSVHLAWHYAVDGYVSIVLTTLIWLGTGRFVRRYSKSSSLNEAAEAR